MSEQRVEAEGSCTSSPEPVADTLVLVPNPAVTVRREPEADGTRVLYERLGERVFLINEVGAAVLALCNGSRTVGEIIHEVRESYACPQGLYIEDEVRTFLTVMVRQKLVSIG